MCKTKVFLKKYPKIAQTPQKDAKSDATLPDVISNCKKQAHIGAAFIAPVVLSGTKPFLFENQ